MSPDEQHQLRESIKASIINELGSHEVPSQITNVKFENLEKSIALEFKGLRDFFELKFAQNDKDHIAVREHLTTLNGQVAKNTTFRVRGAVYLSIAVFFVTTLIGVAINKFT